MARIHEYRIRALIGEGTMGTVYAAERGRGKAALKIMHDAYRGDRALVERFRQHAEAVRSIAHPHLAEIVEVGALPHGQPYVVSEFLKGETLGDRLRRVPCLPIADALDFAAQAAAALGTVHEHGFVHGGLTREDLFLVPDLGMRRGERVKVLDLGAASLRRPPDRTSGLPVGSALYLAPELWRAGEGEVDDRDGRVDVYALAGLLYHALTGVPPHAGATIGELADRHLGHRPASVRSLNPDVPSHVEAAILRALAKRPGDRFASMAAFVRALRVGRKAAAARRTATLRPVAAGLAAAIGWFFLFSAREPSGMNLARTSRALMGSAIASAATEVVARPSRPTIVPLPSEAKTQRAVVHARKAARRDRPVVMTALLDQEDLWGRRH